MKNCNQDGRLFHLSISVENFSEIVKQTALIMGTKVVSEFMWIDLIAHIRSQKG